ncbi:hypothetical protein [Streptomyces sp. NBC_01233]|nr:hypothetical protein OG332_42210 [Streptomyces sp. NBC_01233]
MATKSLAHGMGTFYKDCEHAQSRWSKCPRRRDERRGRRGASCE